MLTIEKLTTEDQVTTHYSKAYAGEHTPIKFECGGMVATQIGNEVLIDSGRGECLRISITRCAN